MRNDQGGHHLFRPWAYMIRWSPNAKVWRDSIAFHAECSDLCGSCSIESPYLLPATGRTSRSLTIVYRAGRGCVELANLPWNDQACTASKYFDTVPRRGKHNFPSCPLPPLNYFDHSTLILRQYHTRGSLMKHNNSRLGCNLGCVRAHLFDGTICWVSLFFHVMCARFWQFDGLDSLTARNWYLAGNMG